MTKRRKQLISAAEQVFAAKGYADTTMADLAEAAGVTRPTVYAYFSSKDDVLAAVADTVREGFMTLQEQSGSTPAETLELTLRAYLSEWVRHYGVLAVIAHQALNDPAYAVLLEEIHKRTNRRHEKFMQRLVDEGSVNPATSPAIIAEMVTGASMRFAQLIAQNPAAEAKYAEALVCTHRALLGYKADAVPVSEPTAMSS